MDFLVKIPPIFTWVAITRRGKILGIFQEKCENRKVGKMCRHLRGAFPGGVKFKKLLWIIESTKC